MNRKCALTTVFFLIAGLSIAVATPISGSAPDFTLPSRSGKNVRLGEMRGQVVLLYFWASWCGLCRRQIPGLEKIYQKYHASGLNVLGINVDSEPKLSSQFLKNIVVSFPVLYDAKSSTSKAYRLEAMPSIYLIDKNGKLRFLYQNYKPGIETLYQGRVRQLLQQ